MLLLGVSALLFAGSGCSRAGARAEAGHGETRASLKTSGRIALEGDPNGLYWDAGESTLYIADDAHNRILTYRDDTGVAKYADLPAAQAKGPGLGQVVRHPDGTLLVARFGFGTSGDVVAVKKDRTSTVVPGLDGTRRRLGLTVAPDGSVYDAYFVKNGPSTVGGVAKLALAGGETDVITGLGKVVGVLATGDKLYVGDQAQGKLFVTSLAAPANQQPFADVPGGDLLCVGPSGSIFSGGADGNVRAIDASGKVTVFASGFGSARGVAYDAANKRLFVASHAASGPGGVEIRPVP
ncbi:MAG: hypothetical protein HOO96_07460 [Polyangiaceae bacterium]|nr:hypothetical protein [Polyangiaceae bacterium]